MYTQAQWEWIPASFEFISSFVFLTNRYLLWSSEIYPAGKPRPISCIRIWQHARVRRRHGKDPKRASDFVCENETMNLLFSSSAGPPQTGKILVRIGSIFRKGLNTQMCGRSRAPGSPKPTTKLCVCISNADVKLGAPDSSLKNFAQIHPALRSY